MEQTLEHAMSTLSHPSRSSLRRQRQHSQNMRNYARAQERARATMGRGRAVWNCRVLMCLIMFGVMLWHMARREYPMVS